MGSLRAADPQNPYALGGMLVAAMQMCDWDTVEKLRPAVEAGVARGTAIVPPFLFLGFSGDPALQLRCAQNAIAEMGLPAVAAAVARRALRPSRACASAISPPIIASIRWRC